MAAWASKARARVAAARRVRLVGGGGSVQGATEAVVSMGGFGLGFGWRGVAPACVEAGVCTPRGLGVESLMILVFWVPLSSM